MVLSEKAGAVQAEGGPVIGGRVFKPRPALGIVHRLNQRFAAQ